MSKINGYDTKRVLLMLLAFTIVFSLLFGLLIGIISGPVLTYLAVRQKKKQENASGFQHKTNEGLSRKQIISLSAFVFLFVFIATIFITAAYIASNSAASGSEEIQPKMSSKIATNATLDDLFYQFVSKSSDLTDLQKQNAWKEYVGKYISGSASVEDVKYESLVGYVVSIESPENQFGREATIYFRDSEKDKLMNIQKGDIIGFYGRLGDYSYILGIVIKDAEVRAT